MIDLELLKKLLSNHTMSSITKKQKEAYKLCLCAIFHNIVSGRHLKYGARYST